VGWRVTPRRRGVERVTGEPMREGSGKRKKHRKAGPSFNAVSPEECNALLYHEKDYITITLMRHLSYFPKDALNL